MENALPLIGISSLFLFIVLSIITIIGVLLKKRWGKKCLVWSTIPLLVFLICFGIQKVINSEKEQSNGSIEGTKKEVRIDFENFEYKVEKYEYKKENNSLDIELSTNIPDGTKVNAGLTKMDSSKEGFVDKSILKSLNLKKEEKVVNKGKIHLHYDEATVSTPFINGQYGAWIDFEVGSSINSEIYDVIGSIDEAEKRFKSTTFSENADKGDYSVILGQQYFDITNSISYNDLKNQGQEKIQQKKASATEIRFAELDKNPGKYLGEFVKYQGQILQIMEEGNSTVIRLAVTKNSSGYDVNDVVYVTYKGTTPAVEKDVVTVYGTIKGSHTYESQAGYHITLPSLEAEIIE